MEFDVFVVVRLIEVNLNFQRCNKTRLQQQSYFSIEGTIWDSLYIATMIIAKDNLGLIERCRRQAEFPLLDSLSQQLNCL